MNEEEMDKLVDEYLEKEGIDLKPCPEAMPIEEQTGAEADARVATMWKEVGEAIQAKIARRFLDIMEAEYAKEKNNE